MYVGMQVSSGGEKASRREKENKLKQILRLCRVGGEGYAKTFIHPPQGLGGCLLFFFFFFSSCKPAG